MKDKIITALRTKYAGLSNSLYDQLASEFLPNITDEGNINEFLDTLNSGPFPLDKQIKVLQSESDRRVNDARKTFETAQKAQQPQQQSEPAKDLGDNPALSKIQALEDRIAKYEKAQSIQQVRSKLSEKLKAEKIPEVFARGLHLESEADLESVLTQAKADYQQVRQEHIDTQVKSASHQPAGSANAPQGIDVMKHIDSYVAAHRVTPSAPSK